MFAQLFANAGLSLDRLRALVEVGAAGGIAKAADGDPTRQSQYSRQIKELEDFFQTKLVERDGKGVRLTAGGKELTRISRFFLLGLSNFQRGCLAEEPAFRIGASATFIQRFLLPVLAEKSARQSGTQYAVEIAHDPEIERRLHDLTIDFGIVTASAISRPLQLKELGPWRLRLWAPKALWAREADVLPALREKRLPLVLASSEIPASSLPFFTGWESRLNCTSFFEARAVLQGEKFATFLPDFLAPHQKGSAFWRVRVPEVESVELHYRLAWNPRLLRLNDHAGRCRDLLLKSLTEQMSGEPRMSRGIRTRKH